jgi:pantothenate kinase
MHSLDPELAGRARDLATRPGRTLLGICGPPGAGKSTIAAHVTGAVGPDRAVVVPMDGFHLAQRVLDELDISDRKGAPDTFDRHGFVALLHRLRAAIEPVVYAPSFDRTIEEPINAAIAVPASTPLVIVEGNYLLAWTDVASLLDEVWYVDPGDTLRRERLVERHVQFGRSRADAEAHALGSDERNAELVARNRSAAHRIIS